MVSNLVAEMLLRIHKKYLNRVTKQIICLLILVQVVFTSDQTYELMYCLEEVEGGIGKGTFSGAARNGLPPVENGFDEDSMAMETDVKQRKPMPVRNFTFSCTVSIASVA